MQPTTGNVAPGALSTESKSFRSSAGTWPRLACAALFLLAACDGAPTAPASSDLLTPAGFATQERLYGAWLREHVSKNGVASRRLLLLDADGRFRETVRLTDTSGVVTEHVHAGTWLYDGTNLKRRYTLMNGSPPSRRRLPFATVQIAFETRNEFVGIDHIHQNQVRYRRVQPETEL